MHDLEAFDYVNRAIQAEVARERERCALLCEIAGDLALAAKIRWGDGPKVREPKEERSALEREFDEFDAEVEAGMRATRGSQ